MSFDNSSSRFNAGSHWDGLRSRVLQIHPEYMEAFTAATDTILYAQGPLPIAQRFYIALMAACRHSCPYLIDLFRAHFIAADTVPDDEKCKWLAEGLESTPSAIRSLDSLNYVLAHQPWSADKALIDEVTRVMNAEESCEGSSRYSLSQVAHAVVILTQVHGLASLCYGCGVVRQDSETVSREEQMLRKYSNTCGNGASARPNGQISGKPPAKGEVESLLQSLKGGTDIDTGSGDNVQVFLDINRQSSELNVTADSLSTTSAKTTECALHTTNLDFRYSDFHDRNRSKDHQNRVLKYHDYSWEDSGYSFLHRMSSTIAEILEKKFNVIKNLTYNTMASYDGVDTSRYRRAIWNYIQQLYGIRHDDYDYNDINIMLSIDMKKFIKTACCYPELLDGQLRDKVMPEFQASERIHVVLIISEARMQAELLYALRAIQQCMK